MVSCNKCGASFKGGQHKSCYSCRKKLWNCPECGKEHISVRKHCRPCENNLNSKRKDTCPKCFEPKMGTSSFCKNCREMPSGPKSHAWKGGRIVQGKGYISIKCPEHPRANSGYVLEHILVMEKHLGRYVSRKETIHHINGCKHDNRIENLELWSIQHPAGIRDQDAISWAIDLLETNGYKISLDS